MKTEIELRKHRCCFTGHRPEKLGGSEEKIRTALEKEIRTAVSAGYTVFISGMARGMDLWAAETVLRLREQGEAVRLICAVPYLGFELRWGQFWKDRYQAILEKADLVKFICSEYCKNCFQIRNQWMVDHSSRVIAVYNGTSGGTRNTMNYALACGIPVVKIFCEGMESER